MGQIGGQLPFGVHETDHPIGHRIECLTGVFEFFGADRIDTYRQVAGSQPCGSIGQGPAGTNHSGRQPVGHGDTDPHEDGGDAGQGHPRGHDPGGEHLFGQIHLDDGHPVGRQQHRPQIDDPVVCGDGGGLGGGGHSPDVGRSRVAVADDGLTFEVNREPTGGPGVVGGDRPADRLRVVGRSEHGHHGAGGLTGFDHGAVFGDLPGHQCQWNTESQRDH